MQNKIQWYEEVMTQDPGSNLFLALARLYVESAAFEKAIQTLQNGLQKNPWHLEAQLLLNDLLHRMDRPAESLEMTSQIGRLLKKHPVFWLNWADQLENEQQNLALAARMLGLAFAGTPPDLNSLCSQGMQKMLEEAKSSDQPQAPLDRSGPEKHYPETAPVCETKSQEQPAVDPEQEAPQGLGDESLGEAFEVFPEDSAYRPSAESEVYRTKTMAEILTNQGDYSAARKIYEHLLREAQSQDDRTELEDRLKTVQKLQLDQGPPPVEPGQRPDPASNKQQLINQLEKLASRLEQM